MLMSSKFSKTHTAQGERESARFVLEMHRGPIDIRTGRILRCMVYYMGYKSPTTSHLHATRRSIRTSKRSILCCFGECDNLIIVSAASKLRALSLMRAFVPASLLYTSYRVCVCVAQACTLAIARGRAVQPVEKEGKSELLELNYFSVWCQMSTAHFIFSQKNGRFVIRTHQLIKGTRRFSAIIVLKAAKRGLTLFRWKWNLTILWFSLLSFQQFSTKRALAFTTKRVQKLPKWVYILCIYLVMYCTRGKFYIANELSLPKSPSNAVNMHAYVCVRRCMCVWRKSCAR